MGSKAAPTKLSAKRMTATMLSILRGLVVRIRMVYLMPVGLVYGIRKQIETINV